MAVDDFGMKISKQGFAVDVAAEKDLILGTHLPLFKVAIQAQTTVGGGATITINHALGYKPNILVWIERASGTNEMRLLSSFGAFLLAYVWVDNNNMKVKNLIGGGSRKVYYYIFHDAI